MHVLQDRKRFAFHKKIVKTPILRYDNENIMLKNTNRGDRKNMHQFSLRENRATSHAGKRCVQCYAALNLSRNLFLWKEAVFKQVL